MHWKRQIGLVPNKIRLVTWTEKFMCSEVNTDTSVLQALFDEVTEAMHLLSHVLHALSDSSIDFREVIHLFL